MVEQELKEILALFRALRRAYDALPDKSKIEEFLITFDGFDANDDLEHEYLKVGRRLAAVNRDIQVFDSHMPRLRGYQIMLGAWRNSRDRENLTKDDILRLMNVE